MKRTKIKTLFFLLLLNGGVLTVSLIYDLLFEKGVVGKCQFFDTFGLYCFGCGGSRALHALLDFKILKSFVYYPPIFISSILILYIDIRLLISLFTKREYKINSKIILIIPSVILMSFIVRYVLLFCGIDPLGNIL